VMEVASNDGYLLQFFKGMGIPVLGIEPAANVAKVAVEKGVPTEVAFFGAKTGRDLVARGIQADLIVANNVLAHVPDINGFVAGFKLVLKPSGCITFEFPHLLELITHNQFDTIYHEHFSYLSLQFVQTLLIANGLRVFDVERVGTHGGSLRVYACHREDPTKTTGSEVAVISAAEDRAGLRDMATFKEFARRVVHTKCELLRFLAESHLSGRTVAGYGAPAKGNTLLNYCGIGRELLRFTVDRSPHKQGLFLPGTHIPIHEPTAIFETKPDYLLILPWNLRSEIAEQMQGIRAWGAQLVVSIPRLEVF
jgi:SAM-dependent methyltransferase